MPFSITQAYVWIILTWKGIKVTKNTHNIGFMTATQKPIKIMRKEHKRKSLSEFKSFFFKNIINKKWIDSHDACSKLLTPVLQHLELKSVIVYDIFEKSVWINNFSKILKRIWAILLLLFGHWFRNINSHKKCPWLKPNENRVRYFKIYYDKLLIEIYI